MSGICGIVHDDASLRVDDATIDAMARAMESRGPDGSSAWTGGRVALAHAMLRTTFEAAAESQPLTLDQRTWLAADARIDAREQLRAELSAAGLACPAGATDPELILRAYRAWGEDCVHHLLGDFAFAIWDAPRQTLFCARDHFGVKPFFHACAARAFVFSNTLQSIRSHPGVAAELDDIAIADFLLFDAMKDPERTAFAAIRRLRPAHCLVLRDGVVTIRRYWSLPRDHGVRYRDGRDYVARFTQLLDQAVRDRLRTDRASVSMSGGLDSPALAAAALRVSRADGIALSLQAHTVVYDRLIPDSERHYSQLAADALGIPIHHRAADEYPLFAGHDPSPRCLAEPMHEPEGAATHELLRDQASHARVSLMGWDGDALLNESPKPYFHTLLREGRFIRLAAGVARYAVWQKRLLPRGMLQRPPNGIADSYPGWINPELEGRLRLRDRWRSIQDAPPVTHPVRPYAHSILSWLDRWSNFFDRFDPGSTGLALEVRHPFLDLRLVEYCLSLPPMPWCVKKHILRESLRGVVPDAVRRRPKTALGGIPGAALLARDDARWVDSFVAVPSLARYVDRACIPAAWRPSDAQAAWKDLRPLTLNFWLQQHDTKHPQETLA